MQSDLLKLLPQFDVVSFDVFDTLLVRNVLNPKDVWRIVGGMSRRGEVEVEGGGVEGGWKSKVRVEVEEWMV